jgi:hypothetical protein
MHTNVQSSKPYSATLLVRGSGPRASTATSVRSVLSRAAAAAAVVVQVLSFLETQELLCSAALVSSHWRQASQCKEVWRR